jgi:hypothetical protein
MSQAEIITGARLRTPRAAAVAGILFSVLLIAIILLLRISIPTNPLDAGSWLTASSGPVALALNLVPIAGVSFLWFISVHILIDNLRGMAAAGGEGTPRSS